MSSAVAHVQHRKVIVYCRHGAGLNRSKSQRFLFIIYSFSIHYLFTEGLPRCIIDCSKTIFLTHLTSDILIAALRSAGVASSAELQRRMGKSQPTLSRLLREADADIVRLGQGRAARYAIPELIWGLPSQQPLHWNDQRRWGTLTFLAGNRIHVSGPKIDVATQGELPWFLDNFRLEGFIGRAWAKKLAFDHNPEKWALAQFLYANCHFAYDPPGAISIGEPAGDLVNNVPSSPVAKALAYDRHADDVASTLPAGSSAGGEQPKFLVLQDANGDPSAVRHLIVKFSPPRGTPFGERWHDLLWAEHLALQVLATNGFAAAQTQVIQSRHRTYLESVRFDRAGLRNKIHTVALSAVHRAFVHGPQRNWAETCGTLSAQKRLPQSDAKAARVLLEYGRLIGNSDMHFGNLSLYAADPAAGRFSLAPAYDMLPMRYRPDIHHGDTDYSFIEPSRPARGHQAEWHQAIRMAREFWRQVADQPAVSESMRKVAERNFDALNT